MTRPAASLALALVTLALLAAGCGDDGGETFCDAKPREPINVDCRALHCVAAVVIDYVRLEPRGYRVFGLEGRPVDAVEAKQRALDHLLYVKRVSPLPTKVDANRSGDFWAVFLAFEDSLEEWLVVVHEPSGQVLFAGMSEWANAERRGFDFPLPQGFTTERALGCGEPLAPLTRAKLIENGQPLASDPASTAFDAFELLQRLDFTKRFSGGRYRAFVISYSPAIGEFDARSADWYAWLYRVPDQPLFDLAGPDGGDGR
ncbi:MAG: hypothetical protein KC503_13275 [Myxococcales bacterium]|nr:hypothetical protein [Myxococcales bacterium]